MITYRVWRRHHSRGPWQMTCHSLQANSDEWAAAKLKTAFAHADFHSMSLVAVPEGVDPNANQTDATNPDRSDNQTRTQ